MSNKYNYKKIKARVYQTVKQACFAQSNKFTFTAWHHHILPVVRHSLELGRKKKADLEVLELAALLHDYSGIYDFDLYGRHHIHSARMADELLSEEGYPEEKIKKVKDCILNHRGSVKSERLSDEEKILASADAMSHITELADMFYLTFGVKKFKTQEGVLWLKAKLDRSWKKTMPMGKKLIAEEYKIAKHIFNQALKSAKQ